MIGFQCTLLVSVAYCRTSQFGRDPSRSANIELAMERRPSDELRAPSSFESSPSRERDHLSVCLDERYDFIHRNQGMFSPLVCSCPRSFCGARGSGACATVDERRSGIPVFCHVCFGLISCLVRAISRNEDESNGSCFDAPTSQCGASFRSSNGEDSLTCGASPLQFDVGELSSMQHMAEEGGPRQELGEAGGVSSATEPFLLRETSPRGTPLNFIEKFLGKSKPSI